MKVPLFKYIFRSTGGYTIREVRDMKEDEKKKPSWEMVDPKPPIIQSGPTQKRQ